MKTIASSSIFMIAMLLTSSVSARSVYLNGYDISDIRNKTFEKAKVTIDQDGNIRIEAQQYDVKIVPPKTAPLSDPGGPNAALSQKYYLVTKPSKGGRAQYDFIVSVNGKDRRLIKSGASQVIVEISAWLKKGENEIVFKAKKDIAGGRKSFSSDDKATVLVGVGKEENKIVKIQGIEGKLEVTGADSDEKSKRLVLVAK